jgi:glycosyltransferase involved in cell wall biosynthesis
MILSPLKNAKGSPEPRVSLVTPSYNAAPYLQAAIESVLAQDYPHIEYLVMDGGSTDGTIELLQEYGEKVHWISESDRGQADAIARGLQRSSGAILGWLNADDVLKPGAVRTAVEAFLAHPDVALVYGHADFIDEHGTVIAPCTVIEPFSRQRLLDYGDYIIQPAAFFSRQAYQSVGGLDTSLHWAMDWDLWIRLAQDHDFIHLTEVLASYRWLGSNKTATGGFDRLQEIEEVARKYGCAGLPAYFRLEKARLHAFLAKGDLHQLRLLPMLRHGLLAATTIFSSWRAMQCLLKPSIWRTYRTAQGLYRHVAERPRETK